MYSKFLAFKTKGFISILSINISKRTLQRKSSIIQTYIFKGFYTMHFIHNLLHREEKDCNNLILPAIVSDDLQRHKTWYKNGKIHRDKIIVYENSTNFIIYDLPAYIYRNTVEWYRHGKYLLKGSIVNYYTIHHSFTIHHKIK